MEPELCFESRNNSCLKRSFPIPIRVTLYIIFGVIVILTVFGNLVVTFSISYFKQLHSPTNYLIFSLAMSDLLVGIVIMFPGMIKTVESCWYFGDFLCKVSLSSNVTLSSASILNLFLISADRYYAVSQPLLYRAKMSNHVVLILILISWSISALTGFGLFFFDSTTLGSEIYQNISCEGQCVLVHDKLSGTLASVFSFYMPAAVLLIVYLRIFYIAKKQSCSIKNNGIVSVVSKSNTSQVKATKTLAIIMGAFLFFWAPFFICSVINRFVNDSVPPVLLSTVGWMGGLNSTVNPLIYAFFYSWFKKAFQLLISGRIFGSDVSETKLVIE